MYDDAILNLSRTIESEFLKIERIYNFELGDEFEIAICNILRKFLPEKYGICRGFAVSQKGDNAGDDIIIYNRSSFPTFFNREPDDFSRKEKIPIEAIYAYIECKHNLVINGTKKDRSSLLYASTQVQKFKKLCNQRDKVLITQSDPYIEMSSQRKAQEVLPKNWWLPVYRNPVFGCIFSRKVSIASSKNIDEDMDKIHELLLKGDDIKKDPNSVDLIIVGPHNRIAPAYFEKNSDTHQNCLFMLPEKEKPGLSCFKHKNQALSIGIIHLMAALDWIKLGRIKWENI